MFYINNIITYTLLLRYNFTLFNLRIHMHRKKQLIFVFQNYLVDEKCVYKYLTNSNIVPSSIINC